MKSKAKIFLACLLLSLLMVNFASAALVNCGVKYEGGNSKPCQIQDLVTTIMSIINFLLSWSALVAMLFIVWAGWNMIGAGGNEETVSTAKTIFKNAIIGFFMIMASFVLLNFIVGLLTGDGTIRAGALIDAFKLIRP